MTSLHFHASTTSTDQRAALLVSAIAAGSSVTFTYSDADGVLSVRTVVPTAIRRCLNGNTCVVAFDLQREAPRCFNLDRIGGVEPGEAVVIVTLI